MPKGRNLLREAIPIAWLQVALHIDEESAKCLTQSRLVLG
jgi:hypothetical protein